jgi:hypothetical protein
MQWPFETPRNPILDDQVALDTAWYHTSTDPRWPTRGRTMTPAEIADGGELHQRHATRDAGREWTDNGSQRERRQLKHRPEGDSRIAPVHPELTRLLRDHLQRFATAPDGRLFSGIRGGELPTITYRRASIKARQTALTPAEQASPLARGPTTSGTPVCPPG